jgi:hypothetical protein
MSRNAAPDRVQLLVMRNELLRQLTDGEERIAVLKAGERAIDRLLAMPKLLEGAERTPLAPLFSREGVGL